MPELPEVETTLQGIKPHIEQQMIKKLVVRNPKLRWPIPARLNKIVADQTIVNIKRRGKYILLECDTGHLLLHLGMSGRVRILKKETAPEKHDHVDIHFSNGKILRYTDPRRFGALLWTKGDVSQHALLKHLGPEPLSRSFDGTHLYNKAKGRSIAVKSFVMDGKIVVGVGNIYATEALYAAAIHPEQPAGKVSLQKYNDLVAAIKKILRQAIKKGGTTLKDFTSSDGSPGYFSQKLKAYGKDGEPCEHCNTKMKLIKIGQRSTVFCPKCQVL